MVQLVANSLEVFLRLQRRVTLYTISKLVSLCQRTLFLDLEERLPKRHWEEVLIRRSEYRVNEEVSGGPTTATLWGLGEGPSVWTNQER
ncbi:unnamed protein product [Gadus morhua 'NCC']